MEYDIPGKDILIHYPTKYTKVGNMVKVEIPGVFSDIDKIKLVQLGWNFNTPHNAFYMINRKKK